MPVYIASDVMVMARMKAFESALKSIVMQCPEEDTYYFAKNVLEGWGIWEDDIEESDIVDYRPQGE